MHWSDAAEYFCAAGATVPRSAGGAEHKLPMLEKFSETQCIFLWHFQRSLAFRMVSEAKKAEHIQAFLYNSAIPAVSHVRGEQRRECGAASSYRDCSGGR